MFVLNLVICIVFLRESAVGTPLHFEEDEDLAEVVNDVVLGLDDLMRGDEGFCAPNKPKKPIQTCGTNPMETKVYSFGGRPRGLEERFSSRERVMNDNQNESGSDEPAIVYLQVKQDYSTLWKLILLLPIISGVILLVWLCLFPSYSNAAAAAMMIRSPNERDTEKGTRPDPKEWKLFFNESRERC